MKIIAVVIANKKENYVLDEKLNLKYVKEGGTIFGTDGTFCDCYYHEQPFDRFKAFAGREFTIELTNGEIVKCNGQWWSGVTSKSRELAGSEIGFCGVTWIEDMRRCYVFTGLQCIKNEIKKLRENYAGPIYQYREFEKMVRDRMRPTRK